MAIVEISIVPLGTSDTSLSKYVAKVIEVIEESGISYQITPMGTILSGQLAEILPVILKMHERCFEEGVKRVLTMVKIDDRRDKKVGPQDKVSSVKAKLEGREP
ncbi:MAG: MTH1187 family thiamine-binding protein [Syntrophobacterales bacterium]|nr:MTH1187 family thiamine-binding protein [Syntrophobacterales bacterium]